MSRFHLPIVWSLAFALLQAWQAQPALSDSLQHSVEMVARFNHSRPPGIAPLTIEDVLCADQLADQERMMSKFFDVPGVMLIKNEALEIEKAKLRDLRRTLRRIVARHKTARAQRMAAKSTRFGPCYWAYGAGISRLISSVDQTLKIESTEAYIRSARRVKADAMNLAQVSGYFAARLRFTSELQRVAAAKRRG